MTSKIVIKKAKPIWFMQITYYCFICSYQIFLISHKIFNLNIICSIYHRPAKNNKVLRHHDYLSKQKLIKTIF